MLPQIVANYVQTGKLRYVFVNFPLSSIHPWAQKSAEAAECAGEQGKYWEMHDALFAGQDQWSSSEDAIPVFEQMAAGLGVDEPKFAACLEQGTYAGKVQADLQEGVAAGVSGTPAFRVNGAALSGARPYADFQKVIEYGLAGGEPPTLEVAADSFRSMGEADAPVVITEFSDFQCPGCLQMAEEVIPEIIKQYVDAGTVRYVYREFPLTSIHPKSQKSSEAAICAGLQDRYWDMNEELFVTEEEWGADSADSIAYFKGLAKDLGLDTAEFDECLDSGEGALTVQGDQMAGEAAGVDATPFFFINTLPVRGGLPLEQMSMVIDYVIAGGETPEIVPRGGDGHVLGSLQTAGAITVAFVDYASSDSRQHALDVLPQLQEAYIDLGRMIYVVHPWSSGMETPSAAGAAAAECAGQEDKFWEMHTQLLEKQEEWTQVDEPQSLFVGYAEDLDLDTGQFEECLGSEWATLRVQAGNVVAALYGVPRAPIFLFNNGEGKEGSPTFEEFKTVIDTIVNQ